MSQTKPEIDTNALINIASSLKGVSVLVVGDIMLDRFVYGRVERISPESPVPILAIQREDRMLGGAGNALANLAGLGVKARILSIIGQDDEGQQICDQIESMGFSAEGLIRDGGRPTIVKTRFLAGHQQLLRSDFERNSPASQEIARQILDRAATYIKDTQAVILSDYGKGLLTPEIIGGIIKLANKAGVPVIVDPKGHDFSIYKGAAAVTPNAKELAEATRGMKVGTNEEVEEAARKIIKECGIEAVVATRSSQGLSIVKGKDTPVHIPGADIQVFDVSGAGDTVIATIAAALAAGADLAQAGALANMAGSVVVTKVGTAPIRTHDLLQALEHHGAARTGSLHSFYGWQEAAEQIRRWQARGRKVGFTNGCFDILHFGHVSYLNDARAQCDYLVVGLNHDASVKILKGPTRPVHDEQSRAAVLGALACVDMVVLFGAEKDGQDNTACDLLALLKPDLYFKGGDYKPEQIPEAPTVKAYGGELRVMPVYEGHSTTKSIGKAKNEAA